jgi:lambda repressor-like predicted transcriptional regulator
MEAVGNNIESKRSEVHNKNCELSRDQRAAIWAQFKTGVSAATLANEFGCHRSTIYDTVQRFDEQNNSKSRSRSGRPKRLTEANKRHLVRTVRRDGEIAWKSLIAGCPTRTCKNTIRKALPPSLSRKFRKLKKIILTVEDARQRLAFCEEWEGRGEDLKAGTYSDECSV